MAPPPPVAGLVIRYAYLWRREHQEGRDEGRKYRPCAIVAAIRIDESGDTRVLVLPISHTQLERPDLAVEIPFKVKNHLQLDDERSWVVLTEWNEFAWPGPDLRRLPGSADLSVSYGMLPPRLFAAIRERFLAIAKAGGALRVPRS